MNSHMTLERYHLPYYVEALDEMELLVTKNLFEETTIVSGLTYNSKEVEKNSLFICKGAAFKEDYLEEAIEKGAIAYVSEKKYDIRGDVPYILVSDIQEAMAPLASIFYNYPQNQLKLIGVGGTKGKTTTTYFFKAVLDAYLKNQGKKPAGIISSIVTYDGIQEEESTNTTPEAVELIRHLANAVEAGLEYFVLEVSSQALKYHRTDGLDFELAIFLNIDEDHISPIEHPNYEDYLTSKLKMFKKTKHLVVNNETADKGRVFKRAQADAENYYTFSTEAKEVGYYASDIHVEGFKTVFTIQTEKWSENYKLAMPGLFNVENASAVIAGTDILGIPQKYAQKVFLDIHVPGRTEFYQTDDEKIIAVVDFAHNRLSFERLYNSIQETYPKRHIVSVFGAPGGKALGRRKELGQIAGEYADFIYLTIEDPRFEEVEDISKEIAVYIEECGKPYQIIEDRVEAIRTAFLAADEQTILLITGKGHETSNNIKGQSVPYATDIYYVQQMIADYNKGIL